MKAKTIGQYKILEFLRNEFKPGSLKIEFIGSDEAIIEDVTGSRARVIYDRNTRNTYIK